MLEEMLACDKNDEVGKHSRSLILMAGRRRHSIGFLWVGTVWIRLDGSGSGEYWILWKRYCMTFLLIFENGRVSLCWEGLRASGDWSTSADLNGRDTFGWEVSMEYIIKSQKIDVFSLSPHF